MESAFSVHAGISFAVQRIGRARASSGGTQNRIGHQLDLLNIQMKERALVHTEQDGIPFHPKDEGEAPKPACTMQDLAGLSALC